MLEKAKAGFAGLDVDVQVKEAALGHLERWLSDPNTAEYVPLIQRLIADGRWELLLDSFYQVIPFGTGGRRGPIGVGPNRINPRTIASSIQGHCQYLQARHQGEISVVVAYDVRRYADLRGLYPADVPNPVMGFTSRDFAEMAAGIYAANGIVVHMLDRGSPRYISTPELSFAIRHLGAKGGLNVSASHNPPDDNGAKIYNEQGGQEIPPYDEELVRIVSQVGAVQQMDWLAAKEQGFVRPLQDSVHNAYIQENVSQSRDPQARSAHVVFTALHGTGSTTVVEVLRAAGFRCDLEPTQAAFDGAFPNVPFGIPNPEVRQSMDRAVAMAEQEGADLVMACDPDADRLGLVVKHQGSWRFINGNEMGALVTSIALKDTQSPRPIVMRSLVTSSLVDRVAAHNGAQMHGQLLVGFKYVAEALRCLETEGRYQHLEGTAADYVIGVEESHGVLVTPNIRDKDAAGAAILLAEAASQLKAEGKTLVDLLHGIWEQVGYVSNTLISTVMRGAAGKARIETIQQSFRDDPPTQIGPYEVSRFLDLRDESGPMGPLVSETDKAARNVLIFELGGAGRLILRPSGTEPKNKIYAELGGAPGADLSTEIPRVDAAARALAEDFALEMLGRVGLSLPRWALQVSDLVPVEQKLHLAHELMPALLARLEKGEEVQEWLDTQLHPYGKDPRGLIADAVRAFVEVNSPVTSPALLSLFA